MVNHKKLFDVMLSMGIPRHIVELGCIVTRKQQLDGTDS